MVKLKQFQWLVEIKRFYVVLTQHEKRDLWKIKVA